MTAAPKAPAKLGDAGGALWRALTSAYEFEPPELVVLAAACRQADDIAALEQCILDDGLVVTGSAGQPRLSAAVTEARQGRLALARLLGDLAIPTADGESVERPMTAASKRAQKAADARWRAQDQKRSRRGPA